MQLNNEQKEAVEYLNGPLLVLAGPGTGKTQLLSSKVAYILQETDANPENILCITFTDSGAANMRDRLASIIGTAAHHINIGTYHSFGADLLKQYKNYSPTFTRQLDTPIDEVTTYRIIKDLQSALNPFDPLRTNSIKDITKTISSAKRARLTPKDLITICEANQKSSSEFIPPISDLLLLIDEQRIRKYAAACETVYNPILDILQKYISPDPLVSQVEPLANFLARDLKTAIDGELQKDKPSVKPLTDWRNKYFEKASDGSFRLKDHIANLKLKSLAKIYDEYQTYLQENALYDFDDMIEEAIHFLQEDEGFRLTISEKYQYILLDEFQDTNPSQFKIIQLITDYESPNIMAVGDDDQTIFEFQGARPDNLIDFQKLYNAKIINLNKNYRSTSEIVNLGRSIAKQIPDSFEKIMNIPKKLTAERNNELATPETTIKRYEFVSSDSEYSWIANEINTLLKNGEPPKNIGIITPQHAYIQPLLPYLKEYNIPISYEKSENILEEQHIKELLTIAHFLYDLSQTAQPSHKLLEILSYPFWELPTLTIVQNIQKEKVKPTLDYLLSSKDQSLKQIGSILSELLVKVATTPLEQFLDYLIGIIPLNQNSGLKSPFLDYYSKQAEDVAFNLYNNLSTLREKVTSGIHSETPTLKDFITLLDNYTEAGLSITSTSPYQDNENSVQIMTVHKSKGLQFKHVYLIAVDDLNWGNAKGNRSFLSLPKNLSFLHQDGTSESELLRKFFVAITRAEVYLTMTNSIRNYAGKTPARLEYLAEYVSEENNTIISPYLPSKTVTPLYEDIDSAKIRTNLHPSWLSHYYHPTPNIRQILLKRLEHYALTATDLTAFIDIVYGGPAEFYKNKILRAPSEPKTPNLNLGNLVHATFEKVTKEGITDDAALDFCKEQIASLQITDSEKEDLETLALTTLQKSLIAFKDIIRNPGSKAELSFSTENINLAGIPLTGVIDHLNIDEPNKTIEVYDFKTSNHQPPKWHTRNTTLYKYRLQLGFYKLLLNLSPTYSKYTVTKGHILYVKPDDFGEVFDESYEYNEADESELKPLITIVYNHIKTLDYLEDPELNLEKDPSRSAKAFFDFIEKLKA